MKNEFNYDKELASKLTILLPLKGRPLFTLRYLLYMEEVKCPFKILIADGSLDEENYKIIDNNKHRFPNVNFEYHCFPPDNTILDFEKKMADALSMIKTPYVMCNSNDDFYIIDTMLKCIDFLEKDIKQEYVACGGKCFYFYTKENRAFSQIYNVNSCNISYYKNSSCEKDTPYERVLQQMPFNYPFIQYAILRKKSLEICYLIVYNNKIEDLMCSEYFTIPYLLTCGKFKVFNIEYTYCQVSVSHWEPIFLINKIFLGSFYSDFQKCIKALASELVKTCDRSYETIKTQLIENWCDALNPKSLKQFIHFQSMLATDYILQIKRIYRKIPSLLNLLRILFHPKHKNLKVIKNFMIRNSSLNH